MASIPKILVIDDERDVGRVIAAGAQAMDLHCVATTDVAVFLKELTPDTTLILLDLMMPETDGIQVLRLLSKQRCKVPIVLMSGVGNRVLETAEQLAVTLGLSINGHLNKPFRLRELQRMLANNATPQALPRAETRPESGIQDEELRSAIEHDEFVVHYQPQIEIATRELIGVEALVRWNHPARGMIFPNNFIGRLEKLDLIDQLGWIVINHGMRDVGQLADETGSIPMLALNVSAGSLRELKFPEMVLSFAAKYGISPRKVTLEITETGLSSELSKTLDVLTRLRMNQFGLSIDDFGTGYAMMQQLRNIPATELKIDKSFVQNIHRSDGDRVIVQKTIEISHQLGIKVVGEGVETREQFDFLREHHCDVVQGYLFSRPFAVKDMVAWMEQYRSCNVS